MVWTEKVAAGLAVKNEKLLPYLYISQGTANAVVDRNDLKGLEFGYEFIEKFIQIPFAMPLPAEQNLENLFTSISRPNAVSVERSFLARLGDGVFDWFLGQQQGEHYRLRAPVGGGSERAEGAGGSSQQETIQKREGLKLLSTGDSERVQNIILTMAPVLGNNPRRIKQFINLFRLKVFIAAETGLFDGDEGLTLEQLGKFVAITLRWPLLIADLETDAGLLQRIHDTALGAKQEGPAARWTESQDLQRAVCAGFKGQLDSTILSGSAWNLKRVSVRRLLEVSPRVRTIDLRAASAPKTSPEPLVGSMAGFAHGTSTLTGDLTFSGGLDASNFKHQSRLRTRWPKQPVPNPQMRFRRIFKMHRRMVIGTMGMVIGNGSTPNFRL